MSPRAVALAAAFARPVSGPSHRPTVRVLGVSIVALLLAWGARGLAGTEPGSLQAAHWVSVAAVVAVLVAPMPSLLAGRTVVDARGVRKLGWPSRQADWSEVQRVRYLPMPLAPRLLVSVGFGRVRVFHSGSRELDAAFERAARLLADPGTERAVARPAG